MSSPSANVITRRSAKPDDLLFIERTFLIALRETISVARGFWDEGRERRQFHEQLQIEHVAIVQYGGIDVGFSIVTTAADGLELNTLCILPEYQSRGIGSEVINRVVQEARETNLEPVVGVLKVNVRARLLYERLGFVVVSESEHHYRLSYGGQGAA